MDTILNKIAALLAFIIGAMAVFAGGKVLIGNDPGYFVINWLPLYNYTIGLLTLTITAAWFWKNSRYALQAGLTTFGLHTLVMIILQTAHRDVVAAESITAMTVRMVTWIIILVLLFFQRRRERALMPHRSPLSMSH